MDKKCEQQALFRYTWPGRDESYICLNHALDLKGIADAMGLYLQLIPLSGIEQECKTCMQNVKPESE